MLRFCELFVKTIRIFFDMVVILLNVMEVLSVGGRALLDRPCMSSKECVCFDCDPSVHLDFISDFHRFCLCVCVCMSEG